MSEICKFVDREMSDWNEHRKLILSELEKLAEKLDRLEASINELKLREYENKVSIRQLIEENEKKNFFIKTAMATIITTAIGAIIKILK